MTNSRLANKWADQCNIKSQPIIVETHARGLKRKIFNPVGGVAKARRMGTICGCPCLCPAGRLDGHTGFVNSFESSSISYFSKRKFEETPSPNKAQCRISNFSNKIVKFDRCFS